MNSYLKGFLITLTGVLVITPDALLIRLIEGNSWTVMFWRGLLSGTMITFGLLLYYRKDFWPKLKGVGWPGLALAVIWGISSLCFVYSIKHTLAANTVFIVSTAPVFAALIAWLVLKEKVSTHTWLTIGACLFGIGIIAYGSIAPSHGQTTAQGSIIGDLAALGAAIAVAITFSIARRYRNVSMIPAMALSAFIAAAIAWPFSAPVVQNSTNFIAIALIGLVVAPLGASLLSIGPRYIPAADVSLLLLLEAVLGPIWVWWVLNEVPNKTTFVGGTFVLLTLFISNTIALLRRRDKA